MAPLHSALLFSVPFPPQAVLFSGSPVSPWFAPESVVRIMRACKEGMMGICHLLCDNLLHVGVQTNNYYEKEITFPVFGDTVS